jgi:hypothetical protein
MRFERGLMDSSYSSSLDVLYYYGSSSLNNISSVLLGLSAASTSITSLKYSRVISN